MDGKPKRSAVLSSRWGPPADRFLNGVIRSVLPVVTFLGVLFK